MKTLILLTLMSVVASFFNTSYAQDSLLMMSNGSIKRVTYLSHGKAVGKSKILKSVPILDTSLYQEYGERKYMESFEYATIVDTKIVYSYNDFLTHKTSTPIIIKLFHGSKLSETSLTSSRPQLTWEWVYMLFCAIILFRIRRRWNTYHEEKKSSIKAIFSFRNLGVSMLTFLGLFLIVSMIFDYSDVKNFLKPFSVLMFFLAYGLVVGLFSSLFLLSQWSTSPHMGINALCWSLILSFTFSKKLGEISWYTLLYIGILFALAYLLGYIIKKKPVLRVVDGKNENT